jgi:hypothetical protein
LPDTWSATENVEWKTEVAGRSWSSPVVWGNRVFLTSVVNMGESEAPKKGLYFGGDRPEPSKSEHLWKVVCLTLDTGKVEWERVVHRGAPKTPIHLKSSYGAETPVVDGERVLVDGGIVNNLPADLVKARCGGTVYASKVAPSDAVLPPPGGFPSAWDVLLHRLLPWRRPLQTPRIGDLLVRTMTVGSAEHMQRVASCIDVLIEPEIGRYKDMEGRQ